jgi:hypothetical protein
VLRMSGECGYDARLSCRAAGREPDAFASDYLLAFHQRSYPVMEDGA